MSKRQTHYNKGLPHRIMLTGKLLLLNVKLMRKISAKSKTHSEAQRLALAFVVLYLQCHADSSFFDRIVSKRGLDCTLCM